MCIPSYFMPVKILGHGEYCNQLDMEIKDSILFLKSLFMNVFVHKDLSI